MISPTEKAAEFVYKYHRISDAVAQAKQCLVLCPDYKRAYWERVIIKIEELY